MQVFESFDIREKFENPVLTIGNYDGIHLGHRRIIERVKERARELSGTSMLMTFRPHPLHVLQSGQGIGRHHTACGEKASYSRRGHRRARCRALYGRICPHRAR